MLRSEATKHLSTTTDSEILRSLRSLRMTDEWIVKIVSQGSEPPP